jgi:hypothetical protein
MVALAHISRTINGFGVWDVGLKELTFQPIRFEQLQVHTS